MNINPYKFSRIKMFIIFKYKFLIFIETLTLNKKSKAKNKMDINEKFLLVSIYKLINIIDIFLLIRGYLPR